MITIVGCCVSVFSNNLAKYIKDIYEMLCPKLNKVRIKSVENSWKPVPEDRRTNHVKEMKQTNHC